MDMQDGNQVEYLCGGLAATCGTLGLTQITCGFGLTARRSDLGTAGLGLGTADLGIPLVRLSFCGANTCHGWNNQSRSIRTYNNLYLVV